MMNHHQEGLVYVTDLSGFGRVTRNMEVEEVAAVLQGYAARTEAAVREAGGELTAMINDSALGWFPPDAADAGVNGLVDLKQDLEAWFAVEGWGMKVSAGAHYGDFMVIYLPPGDTANIIGDTVNTAFTLGTGNSQNHRNRLVLSATAFRKLSPETRKRFYKFTEPIVYLAE